MTRVYICEKPSQARDLAQVLGFSRRGDGFIDGGDQVVTWALGHLLEMKPPEAYDERFKKLWEFYLHYCEAGFRAEYIDVRQVVYKA